MKYLIHPNYLFSHYSIAEHPAPPILQREDNHKIFQLKKLFSEYFYIFLLLTLFLPVNFSI